MEAKVKGDDYGNEYYIEVSWDGWITFGEFLHGVFDALGSHIRGGFPCHTAVDVKCKGHKVDEYDWGKDDYKSDHIEIVPTGSDEQSLNFVTTSYHSWNQKLARIGIRTRNYIDCGRHMREFSILGVNWDECGFIYCLPPEPTSINPPKF